MPVLTRDRFACGNGWVMIESISCNVASHYCIQLGMCIPRDTCSMASDWPINPDERKWWSSQTPNCRYLHELVGMVTPQPCGTLKQYLGLSDNFKPVNGSKLVTLTTQNI